MTIFNTSNASGINVYSNNKLIGQLINWTQNSLNILTTKKYFVTIHHNGSLRHKPLLVNEQHFDEYIYYLERDCEGDAFYRLAYSESYPSAYPLFGSVIYDIHNKKTFYIPHNPPVRKVLAKSSSYVIPDLMSSTNNGCANDSEDDDYLNLSGTGFKHGILLLKNMEKITGVPNGGFKSPIRIGDVN